MNRLDDKYKHIIKGAENRKTLRIVLAVVSLAVVFFVFAALSRPGITMTSDNAEEVIETNTTGETTDTAADGIVSVSAGGTTDNQTDTSNSGDASDTQTDTSNTGDASDQTDTSNSGDASDQTDTSNSGDASDTRTEAAYSINENGAISQGGGYFSPCHRVRRSR